VFTFGSLEMVVDMALRWAMGVDEAAGNLLNGQIISIDTKLKLIESRISHFREPAEAVTSCKAAIKNIQELLVFRNNLLHGPWNAYFNGDATWQKIGISRSGRLKKFEVTLADINAKTKEVSRASAMLSTALSDILAARA
jgi:hypothetical protein